MKHKLRESSANCEPAANDRRFFDDMEVTKFISYYIQL